MEERDAHDVQQLDPWLEDWREYGWRPERTIWARTLASGLCGAWADEIHVDVALEHARTHKPVSGVSRRPGFEWWMECEGRLGRDLWTRQRSSGKKSVRAILDKAGSSLLHSPKTYAE
jgi:hypothetical protein